MQSDTPGRDEETIQVVRQAGGGPARWRPAIGNEALELLRTAGLPESSRSPLLEESTAILSRCVPPANESGAETGLVVGHIQSGKTMSFTTVAALARDNGYPMVIVIAGTSKPLMRQSYERLRRDLRLASRRDRKWVHIHNPEAAHDHHNQIRAVLDEWRDPDVFPEERRTVLVTVMKHHQRLANLIDVLMQLDLGRTPTLVFDDEADQAGLNNLIKKNDESTTYRRLLELRRALPHHGFLQYTATPQGPLLINLIDVLSPGFAVVLTPGLNYTGGQMFFRGDRPLVREIPYSEIPTGDRPLLAPPETLREALRLFFLGVADGWVRNGGEGNRSMMIHPSFKTDPQQQYCLWVSTIVEDWIRILRNSEDPDFADLLDDYRTSYDDLRATVPDLSPFDDLRGRLRHAIRRTVVHEVNARQKATPQIDWSNAYSNVLVGGQALDRGFTVEGLTVTYMPRGIGVGNADTIQQRARFLGYKRDYMGFCRVFLEPAVADAFRRYVEHEEFIRERLKEHAESGEHLSGLRRAFLLAPDLKPTRGSIIDTDYVRLRLNARWFYPRAPHESDGAVEGNRKAIKRFSDMISLERQEHPQRTPIQTHESAEGISLQLVYEELLTNLRFARLNDAQNFLGVLTVVRAHLDEFSGATCSVYRMSCGMTRERTLNDASEIPNLFQGAAPVNPPERRGSIYPGDREIHAADGVTVQIHNLVLRGTDGDEKRDVPNVAVWIPRGMGGDVIIQNQGSLPEHD